MSAHINETAFRNFFIKEVGGDKISHDKAKALHIDDDKFEEANDNDNNYLEINEVLEDKDLYAQFASMYIEAEEAKSDSEKDAEKEKEEKNKVKDKNGAGAA